MLEAIKNSPVIGVDLEGERLSKDGEICILQISTGRHSTVFLVDICVLGERAFAETGSGSLRDILESDTIAKLIWDVRCDSNALFHIYNIKLAAVIDLQMWEIACRFFENQESPYLTGLANAIERDCSSQLTIHDKLSSDQLLKEAEISRLLMVKHSARRLFSPYLGGSFAVWRARPLHPVLIEYCTDTLHLFDLRSIYSSRLVNSIGALFKQSTAILLSSSRLPPHNILVTSLFNKVRECVGNGIRRRLLYSMESGLSTLDYPTLFMRMIDSQMAEELKSLRDFPIQKIHFSQPNLVNTHHEPPPTPLSSRTTFYHQLQQQQQDKEEKEVVVSGSPGSSTSPLDSLENREGNMNVGESGHRNIDDEIHEHDDEDRGILMMRSDDITLSRRTHHHSLPSIVKQGSSSVKATLHTTMEELLERSATITHRYFHSISSKSSITTAGVLMSSIPTMTFSSSCSSATATTTNSASGSLSAPLIDDSSPLSLCHTTTQQQDDEKKIDVHQLPVQEDATASTHMFHCDHKNHTCDFFKSCSNLPSEQQHGGQSQSSKKMNDNNTTSIQREDSTEILMSPPMKTCSLDVIDNDDIRNSSNIHPSSFLLPSSKQVLALHHAIDENTPSTYLTCSPFAQLNWRHSSSCSTCHVHGPSIPLPPASFAQKQTSSIPPLFILETPSPNPSPPPSPPDPKIPSPPPFWSPFLSPCQIAPDVSANSCVSSVSVTTGVSSSDMISKSGYSNSSLRRTETRRERRKRQQQQLFLANFSAPNLSNNSNHVEASPSSPYNKDLPSSLSQHQQHATCEPVSAFAASKRITTQQPVSSSSQASSTAVLAPPTTSNNTNKWTSPLMKCVSANYAPAKIMRRVSAEVETKTSSFTSPQSKSHLLETDSTGSMVSHNRCLHESSTFQELQHPPPILLLPPPSRRHSPILSASTSPCLVSSDGTSSIIKRVASHHTAPAMVMRRPSISSTAATDTLSQKDASKTPAFAPPSFASVIKKTLASSPARPMVLRGQSALDKKEMMSR